MRSLSTILLCVALLTLPTSNAAGQTLYGADGAQGNLSNLYILDPTDGSVIETIGAIGFAVTGLAFDPTTGLLYGSTSRNDPQFPRFLITIDIETGAGQIVGEIHADETAADLAFTEDGALYGMLEPAIDELALIDKATGEATVIGDTELNNYGSGLIAASNEQFYLAAYGDTFDETCDCGLFHTLNRSNGSIFSAIPLVGGSGEYFPIGALAVDCAGTIYGARIDFNDIELRPVDLITIDPNTGQITVLGPTVDRIDALAFLPFCIADLSVQVTASPNPVVVGNIAQAEIFVTNHTDDPATNVIVSIDLANSLDFQFASGDCTEIADAIECSINRLNGQSSQSFFVAYTTTFVGTRFVSAEVSSVSEDPQPDNNTDSDLLDIIAPSCFNMIGAESLLVHGANPAGEPLEIGIDLLALNGIEPRIGGPQRIVVTTDVPLDQDTVNAANVQLECNGDSPNHTVTQSAENTMTIDFEQPIADGQRCSLRFNGVTSDLGAPAMFSLPIAALAGDMDGNGGVTGGDAALIKPFFNTVIDENSEFPQYDYDRSGGVSGSDFALIKPLFGHLVPQCP